MDDKHTKTLTITEQHDLDDHEQIIGKHIRDFIEVGRALADICKRRLYRRDHKSFETYCRDKWDLSRPYAYQLIDAAELAASHPEITSVRQARALSTVPSESRQVVVEKAKKAGDLTAKSIKDVAAVVAPKPVAATGQWWKDGVGGLVDHPAFKTRAKILEAISDLSHSRQKFGDVAGQPGSELLVQGQLASLANVRKHAYESLPHAICRTCHNRGASSCEDCGGRGWITKVRFKQLMKELTEASLQCGSLGSGKP